MSRLKVKIDGKEVQVEEGKTILEACQDLGIDIPTLCYHKELAFYGACRMCVVEAGPGALKPACATYLQEGMEIKTTSPEIEEIRKTILQLLFAERNHYCMYCEISGNCELQDLGYRYGLDHFEFPPYEEKFPVDTTHPYILFDQNRCVLCRRCARACAELAGHYVLEVKGRGSEALISSDLDYPFRDSSCTSCGLCVQICPTGALVDKRSSYLGKKEEAEITKTNCDRCPLGCGIEVYKRANYILKIWGDFDYPLNRGVLCAKGRYLPLEERRARLESPKIKRQDSWEDCSLKEASEILKELGKKAEVFLEGSLSLEMIFLFKEAFGDRVFSLHEVEPPIPPNAGLKDIEEASTYLVLSLDLNHDYGVLGSFIKRRVREEKAKLILVGEKNSLADVAISSYSFKDLSKALEEARLGEKTLAIYSDLPSWVAREVALEPFGFLFLPYETNTLAFQKLGIKAKSVSSGARIYVGENVSSIERSPGDYIIVFSPFDSEELKGSADLLLPLPWFLEEEGTFLDLEGKEFKRAGLLASGPDVLSTAKLRELLKEVGK